MARKKTLKPLKYKHGDMVYSYQNPNTKRPITFTRRSDDPDYQHAYKVSLRDKEGYSYSSKWISEQSLMKRRNKKFMDTWVNPSWRRNNPQPRSSTIINTKKLKKDVRKLIRR